MTTWTTSSVRRLGMWQSMQPVEVECIPLETSASKGAAWQCRQTAVVMTGGFLRGRNPVRVVAGIAGQRLLAFAETSRLTKPVRGTADDFELVIVVEFRVDDRKPIRKRPAARRG